MRRAQCLSGSKNGESIAPILFSEFADSEVEALLYGINSQPDKLIRLENFRDYQDQIFSTSDNNIEYVTSRLIFTDKTKSEIRKSELKR